MTSHASARNAIKATAPGAWRLEWLVCVDWYDGVESGFVVLDGPVRLGVAVERLGGAGHVTVYRGWLLPTGAAGVVAAMGEADAPAPWARHFTPNAPMDAETIDPRLRGPGTRAVRSAHRRAGTPRAHPRVDRGLRRQLPLSVSARRSRSRVRAAQRLVARRRRGAVLPSQRRPGGGRGGVAARARSAVAPTARA